MATLDTEFKYYQDNKEHFLAEYKGKFIVIKGEEVIGTYDDRIVAIEETKKIHKLGTFLVHEVIENDEIMFHSRVLIGKKRSVG